MFQDVTIYHNNVFQKKNINNLFQIYKLLIKCLCYKWILINFLLILYSNNWNILIINNLLLLWMDKIMLNKLLLSKINIQHRMISFSMARILIKANFLITQNLLWIWIQMIISQYFNGKFYWIIYRLFTQDKHTASYKCLVILEEY